MKNSKKFIVLAFALILALALTACGGEKTSPVEEGQGGKLEGAVIVDGSGTVYPLMAHIAEEYMTNEAPGVSVQVGRAGSSAGFKKFIAGDTDFSDASRKIKDEEIAQLKENGTVFGEDVMEIKLAYDGLTMVINKNNDWAVEMTEEEIVNMYLSETYNSDDEVLWSDIRSEWPTEKVNFYGPNENHGTFEFFYEVILDKQDIVKTANLQQEYSTLVDLVANDKYAIAFFGYGYYASNTDKLQAVNIDFGEGPVGPALETIGEELPYAGFTRLVYTYLNLNYAKEKPQVLDYAMYVVSPEGAEKLAGENGFAPLPSDMYAEYLSQLKGIK